MYEFPDEYLGMSHASLLTPGLSAVIGEWAVADEADESASSCVLVSCAHAEIGCSAKEIKTSKMSRFVAAP